MHGTIGSIIKIAAVILSFSGAFCLAALFSRGRFRFRKAAENELAETKKIYSFLLIDVNKTGENTDMIIAGINGDINSGKVDYIHKILLFDGADIAGFIEEAAGKTGTDPKDGETEKMCGIITEKYDNILYLKR